MLSWAKLPLELSLVLVVANPIPNFCLAGGDDVCDKHSRRFVITIFGYDFWCFHYRGVVLALVGPKLHSHFAICLK